jgi:hypothetical protein
MQNSKLISLLCTFTTGEVKRFRSFLQSPYFQCTDEANRLAQPLLDAWPDFDKIPIEKELDTKKLNYQLSEILQLAYKFLALEEMRNQRENEINYFTLKTLSNRGLEKHYSLLLERTKENALAQQKPDADLQLYLFRLEDLDRKHIDQLGLRKHNESLQRAADRLDLFYLLEKLKHTCAMLNSQLVLATAYEFRFIAELKTYFETNAMPEGAPGIAIYYQIFRMLTLPDADAEFEQLKLLMYSHRNSFEKSELTNIYGYALNYANVRSQSGRFAQEALDLYTKGIENTVLLEDGKLSPWHFKNIIKLALVQKQYVWTEQFILEKSALLDESFKADAVHYNLAELHFFTGKYDQALHHLNKVEFTDINYNLGAKLMLVKIYFEQSEFTALQSLLHAFKTFLMRNREISENFRKAYLNFIKCVKMLEKVNKRNAAEIRVEIEKMELITAKAWLLAQLR